MTNNNTQANNISQWIRIEEKENAIEVKPALNDSAKRLWDQWWFNRGDVTPRSMGLIKDKAHSWLERYAEWCEWNKAEPDQEWLMG
tara:strand:+ start:318 stop:575 length:258 start_codon:yes stop_codon:yes gene_type:complete